MYKRRINPSPSAKYLGIHIDNKLNFNTHTKMIEAVTITRASHFRSLTFKNKRIATIQATTIYKCICRPLLEYGNPI